MEKKNGTAVCYSGLESVHSGEENPIFGAARSGPLHRMGEACAFLEKTNQSPQSPVKRVLAVFHFLCVCFVLASTLATLASPSLAHSREQRLECRVRRNTQSIDEFWVRGPTKSLAASKNLNRVNPQGVNYRYRIPMGEITGAGGWVSVRYQEQADHWVVGLQKDTLISGQRIQADGSEVGESHSFPPLRRGKSILYVTLTLTDMAATRTATRVDLDCHLNFGG